MSLHFRRLTVFVLLNRLRELKAKLKEQRKHLDELDQHMYVRLICRPRIPPTTGINTRFANFYRSDQLTKEQGGEQN
jgi:hypothetical protein